MTSDLKTYRTTLERRKGEKLQILKNLNSSKRLIRENKRSLKIHEKARVIIRQVGLETQQQLQYHISDITTLAMDAVFNDPYKLNVEFVERRNKTECDLLFERRGNISDPMDSTGGGAVDVAAFALRIASWSMQRPQSRSVIILDEPLRYLDRNRQEPASQMIKELSEKLGIQFIIVTHEPTLASYADKVFEVSIRKGISKIK